MPTGKMATNPPSMTRNMQRIIIFGINVLLIFRCGTLAAENLDDTLLTYAISIRLSSVQQSWSGYGIYLGKGLFVTASHVVGRAWITHPKVALAGKAYPTDVVKEGNFDATDLTLLSVEETLLPMRLRLRRNTLCKDPPFPGEDV